VYKLNRQENQRTQELFEAYKQRNEVEIMLKFLHADKMYMHDRHVLEGWLFANFIAMIAYYKLYCKLKQAKLFTKYSPKDIIELSKSIYQIEIRGE
jgi:transposase